LKPLECLAQNLNKMTEFKKTGYIHLKNHLNSDLCKLLSIEIRMVKDIDFVRNNHSFQMTNAFGDELVRNSYSIYGHAPFESLMVLLQPTVEFYTDLQLHPCYAYGRIMWSGAFMEANKYRYSCEISCTICIDSDNKNDYPIYIEDYQGNINEIIQKPGDVLIYKGTELTHHRNVYKGQEQIQVLLHYVDSQGPHASHKNDGRQMLGTPKGRL
jgi:hypothetical protein